MKSISLIAAISENNVIGKGNEIPWHYSEDLRHFKQITTSHVVIMGRKTFESIGKPLPNRVNIVLSRSEILQLGIYSCSSFAEAIVKGFEHGDHLFLIGGVSVYREGLKIADTFYKTQVLEEHEGDVFFPPWSTEGWELVSERPSTKNPLRFQKWVRLRETTRQLDW